MEAPPEPTPPVGTKRSSGWWVFIVWPLVILVLYALSFGPVVMMVQKGIIRRHYQRVYVLYEPVMWAYEETPLQKPLGMYFHLWAPELFDKHGDPVGLSK